MINVHVFKFCKHVLICCTAIESYILFQWVDSSPYTMFGVKILRNKNLLPSTWPFSKKGKKKKTHDSRVDFTYFLASDQDNVWPLLLDLWIFTSYLPNFLSFKTLWLILMRDNFILWKVPDSEAKHMKVSIFSLLPTKSQLLYSTNKYSYRYNC
jgi:hypothetical protein